jgi:lysophospholipase L1-like esterase
MNLKGMGNAAASGGVSLPQITATTVGFGSILSSSVVVNWTTVINAYAYEVYRNTSNTLAGAIPLTLTTGLAFTDLSAPSGTTQYYLIVAIPAYGTPYSNSNPGINSVNVPSADYVTFVDDNFTRANTTPPASIGSPAIFSSPSTGAAWTDYAAANWKILNNALVPGTAVGGALEGPYRPEMVLNNQQIINTGPIPTPVTGNFIPYILSFRKNPISSYYSALGVQVGFNTSTLLMQITAGYDSLGTIYQGTTSGTAAFVIGHSYIITARVESFYAGGFTTISANVVDAANPTVPLLVFSSQACTFNGLLTGQNGRSGFSLYRTDLSRSDLQTITRYQLQQRSSSGLTSTVRPLFAGTNGNYVTVSSTSLWTPGASAPAFTLSGLSGCTLVSQTFLSPQLCRLKINVPASQGTLRITDSSNGNYVDVPVVTTLKATDILVIGDVVPIADTSTTVKQQLGLCTGGKAPYTFQWHRSTTAGFVPGVGTVLPGATSIDLIDTPPDGQQYTYKCVATDSSTVPQTSTSLWAPGIRNYQPAPTVLYTPTGIGTPANIGALKIGFIGDSLTYDGTFIANMKAAISAKGYTVSTSNQGVPGAYSGAGNANGWAPTNTLPTPTTNIYLTAKAALHTFGATHIMLMLGTNDAQAYNVAKATYITNMNAILAQLAIDFPGVMVIINMTLSGTRTVSGVDCNDRLCQYQDAIDQVVAANTNARRGDRFMFEYSYGKYYLYNDDIHPNATGYNEMASFWTEAFLKNIDGILL